ncbi:hypothetical protein C4Q28_02010 [Pseudomonas sp. SWI6]|nr:hypothetical protein C4Q28_02010 [Pseudomonas sp. SWI6]AVD87947.1 hypothetical protein C4Q26_12595 [Pseudomonas sp. SWI44]
MEYIAKAKTRAQDRSGYTGNRRIRNEFDGQKGEKRCDRPLRGVVREGQASIIAASAADQSSGRANRTEIPDGAALAARTGRDKRTM